MRDNVPCEFPAGYDGAAVLERLAQVLDPELGESILDLGFVRSLELRSGHADVALRLPVYQHTAPMAGIALTRKGRSENDFMARPSPQRTLWLSNGLQQRDR
jgi:hypothetical protein